MLQHIKPLVEGRIEFSFGFRELRHFEIDQRELVIKNAVGLIFQLNGMTHLLVFLILSKNEIENPDEINGVEFEVPFLAAFGLLVNGKGRVKNAAFLEIILLGFLHLDDEAFAALTDTEQIEDGAPIFSGRPQPLAVGVTEFLDLVMFRQQLIKEVDQQVLIRFAAEQFLEAEIGEWI